MLISERQPKKALKLLKGIEKKHPPRTRPSIPAPRPLFYDVGQTQRGRGSVGKRTANQLRLPGSPFAERSYLYQIKRFSIGCRRLSDSLSGWIFILAMPILGLGHVLTHLGHYKKAATAFQNALQLNPKHVSARQRLADLYKNHLGQPELAMHHFSKAREYQVGIITVVSGLPRSGTSMMMQMLEKGGLEPVTDRKREQDEKQPKGLL